MNSMGFINNSSFMVTIIFFVVLNCMYTKLVQAKNFQPSNWNSATATFYGEVDASGTNGGACGYGNLFNEGYGINSTALSIAFFGNGELCGACFELICDSNQSKLCYTTSSSIFVTTTNLCPSGSEGGWCDAPNVHFDLSQPIFSQFAPIEAGVVHIHYRRVPCQKNGGMKFTINGHQYWALILVTNVAGAGDIQELYIKGSNTDWLPLTRNWGDNWQLTENVNNLIGQPLSFKVVASDKSEVVSMNVAPANWQFSQTFEGSNF